MPSERVQARIGDLSLPVRYSDPSVDVSTEAITVEHETVSDDVVVQHLGRRADRITIEGVIPEDDISTLDDLTRDGQVTVRTQRWSGQAVVVSTSSNYTHSYDVTLVDDDINEWLYEFTVDLVEVSSVPSDHTSGGAGTGTGGIVQIDS